MTKQNKKRGVKMEKTQKEIKKLQEEIKQLKTKKLNQEILQELKQEKKKLLQELNPINKLINKIKQVVK